MFDHVRQIAEFIIKNFSLRPLTRNEKRTKSHLYKWYDDNVDIIKPILDNIVVEDSNHHFYGVRRDEFTNNNE